MQTFAMGPNRTSVEHKVWVDNPFQNKVNKQSYNQNQPVQLKKDDFVLLDIKPWTANMQLEKFVCESETYGRRFIQTQNEEGKIDSSKVVAADAVYKSFERVVWGQYGYFRVDDEGYFNENAVTVLNVFVPLVDVITRRLAVNMPLLLMQDKASNHYILGNSLGFSRMKLETVEETQRWSSF